MASDPSLPKHAGASTIEAASTNVVVLDAHRRPAELERIERRRHAERLRAMSVALHGAPRRATDISKDPLPLRAASTASDDLRVAIEALDELLVIRANEVRALTALREYAIDPAAAGAEPARVRELLMVIIDDRRREQLACAVEHGMSLAAGILVRDDRDDIVDAREAG